MICAEQKISTQNLWAKIQMSCAQKYFHGNFLWAEIQMICVQKESTGTLFGKNTNDLRQQNITIFWAEIK